jgi:hypothetical protein
MGKTELTREDRERLNQLYSERVAPDLRPLLQRMG